MRGVIAVCSSILGAGLLLSAGCASKPVTASAGNIKVVAENSRLVELPPPTVVCDDGVLKVSGVAKRKEGVDTPLVGHVLLIVADKDGKGIKYLRLGWTPSDIPTTGDRQSAYSLNYVWTPPSGSTLYVTYDEEPDFRVAGGRAGSAANISSGAAGFGAPGTISSVPQSSNIPPILRGNSAGRADEYAPMNYYFPRRWQR